MRAGVWCWVALWLMAWAWGCRSETRPPPAPRPASHAQSPIDATRTQLVTVVAEDWNGFETTLQRYERAPDGAWETVGASIETVIGRSGYGWGRGLHGDGAPSGRPGPTKREGDGRSPAGAFEIGTAYGYAPTLDGVSLPYAQATALLRCVDDPRSRHYNRIVSMEDTPVDWNSAEHMRRDDDLYTIAIVVEHNTRGTKPGAGSCIFVHVWRGPGIGMTGCTAMAMDTLEEVARWLKPGAVWVALPEREHAALQSAWALP